MYVSLVSCLGLVLVGETGVTDTLKNSGSWSPARASPRLGEICVGHLSVVCGLGWRAIGGLQMVVSGEAFRARLSRAMVFH